MVRGRGFTATQIFPRWRSLILDARVLAALIVAAVSTFAFHAFGTEISGEPPTFADVGTAILAFAGITFGGCVAAATLAIALPSGRTLSILAINGSDQVDRKLQYIEGRLATVDAKTGVPVGTEAFDASFHSRYMDLVFVFVFSAIVQLTLSALASAAILILGGLTVFGKAAPLESTIGLFVLLAATSYSISQLVACLRALFDVGLIRDSSIRGASVEQNLGDLEP
jgi:hypothetical protein